MHHRHDPERKEQREQQLPPAISTRGSALKTAMPK